MAFYINSALLYNHTFSLLFLLFFFSLSLTFPFAFTQPILLRPAYTLYASIDEVLNINYFAQMLGKPYINLLKDSLVINIDH